MKNPVDLLKIRRDAPPETRHASKHGFKHLYRSFARRVFSPKLLLRARQLSHIDSCFRDVEAARAGLAEIWLRQQYPALFSGLQTDLPEFSLYSQNGEDGILLSLIDQTGAACKKFVEIGVDEASECNTAVLAFLLGWDGLMIEADRVCADSARRRVERLLVRKRNRVAVRQMFVTAENVNGVIDEAGFGGELGVLSIDVDGVDYWLWKAIRIANPRIVVIEYNASFGATQAVTVPYKPDFQCLQEHPSGFYHGASLPALELLGKQLGYVLVAVESAGVNAFFVRQDICPPALAGTSAAELFQPHRERSRTLAPDRQWEIVRPLPLVTTT